MSERVGLTSLSRVQNTTLIWFNLNHSVSWVSLQVVPIITLLYIRGVFLVWTLISLSFATQEWKIVVFYRS